MAKQPSFTSRRDTKITGWTAKVSARANAIEIRDVVSALKFGMLDPFGKEHRIGDRQHNNPQFTVRLDRQPNPTERGANLQIQVNDAALKGLRLAASEGTTIAQVIVPITIYQRAISASQPGVQAHLENVVRSALLTSHASLGFQYRIVEE